MKFSIIRVKTICFNFLMVLNILSFSQYDYIIPVLCILIKIFSIICKFWALSIFSPNSVSRFVNPKFTKVMKKHILYYVISIKLGIVFDVILRNTVIHKELSLFYLTRYIYFFPYRIHITKL